MIQFIISCLTRLHYMSKDIVKANYNTHSISCLSLMYRALPLSASFWNTEIKFIHYQTTKFKNCVITWVSRCYTLLLAILDISRVALKDMIFWPIKMRSHIHYGWSSMWCSIMLCSYAVCIPSEQNRWVPPKKILHNM